MVSISFTVIYLFFIVIFSESLNVPQDESSKKEPSHPQSTNINVEKKYPLNITTLPSNWSQEIIDCDYSSISEKYFRYNYSASAIKNEILNNKVSFKSTEGHVIGCLLVKSNLPSGENGEIRVFAGGRSQYFVTLEAISKKSLGYSFEVTLYQQEINNETTSAPNLAVNNVLNQTTNEKIKPFKQNSDHFNCSQVNTLFLANKLVSKPVGTVLDNSTAAEWADKLEDCDYNNINGPKFQGTFFQPKKNNDYVSELIGYEASDGFNITCYNVTSNIKNGKIRVISGGRNQPSIYFEAKSKLNEAFSFQVTIYLMPKIIETAASNNFTTEVTEDIHGTETTTSNLHVLVQQIFKTSVSTTQKREIVLTTTTQTTKSNTEEVTKKNENFCLFNITQVPSDWMDDIFDCDYNRIQGNERTYELHNVGPTPYYRNDMIGFEASFESEITCYIVKSRNPNGKIRVKSGGRNKPNVKFEAKHIPGKNYNFKITVFEGPKDGNKTCPNNFESTDSTLANLETTTIINNKDNKSAKYNQQVNKIKGSVDVYEISKLDELQYVNYAKQVEKKYGISKTLTVCGFPKPDVKKVPLKITKLPSKWVDELEDCDYTRIQQPDFEHKLYKVAKVRQSVNGWIGYEAPEDHEICCFIVKSNINNGSNGKVRVISGGRNKRFVDIQAISQLGKGFDFNVTVYSAPKFC